MSVGSYGWRCSPSSSILCIDLSPLVILKGWTPSSEVFTIWGRGCLAGAKLKAFVANMTIIWPSRSGRALRAGTWCPGFGARGPGAGGSDRCGIGAPPAGPERTRFDHHVLVIVQPVTSRLCKRSMDADMKMAVRGRRAGRVL